MKKLSIFTVLAVFITLLASPLANAASKTSLGSAVNWIRISTQESYYLNGSAVTFMNKSKNSVIGKGLNKKVVYYRAGVSDSSKVKPNLTYYPFSLVNKSASSTFFQSFSGNQKTKTVYAQIVFYDKNKKPIAHQDKVLTVKKLVTAYNKSIKKLSSTKVLKLDQKNKQININLTKVTGEYWSYHVSRKPITVASALKDHTDLKTYSIASFNPLNTLSYYDRLKPSKGTLYTMIIVYDKKFKPISYITQNYKASSF